MRASELGSYIVRRYSESYTAEHPVSLTLLDLRQADELFASVEVLARMLIRHVGEVGAREQMATSFARSQTAPRKAFVDLADLCLNLLLDGKDPLVIEAARAVGNFLISPKPPLVGQSAEGRGRPFVVDHGRNAAETARLNGLSIYAPHVSPAEDFDALHSLYQSFVFAQKTQWSELVHTLARF